MYKNLIFIFFILFYSCKYTSNSISNSSKKIGVRKVTSLKDNSITYNEHIKSILSAKCLNCHGKGSVIADLSSYEAVFSKKDLIFRKVVIEKSMPKVGSLTNKELELIAVWVKTGALKERPKDIATTTPENKPVQTITIEDNIKEYVQKNCLTCHGQQGSALSTPIISGLDEKIILQYLNDFSLRKREDLIMGAMNDIAMSLNQKQMKLLARHISKLNPCDVIDKNNLPNGSFDDGEESFHSKGCIGCHSNGNPLGAPNLFGQKSRYLFKTLQEFKSKRRKSGFMNNVAQNITTKEMEDISHFLEKSKSCE